MSHGTCKPFRYKKEKILAPPGMETPCIAIPGIIDGGDAPALLLGRAKCGCKKRLFGNTV